MIRNKISKPLSTLIQHSIEVLATIRQRKEIKGIQIRKKDVKLLLLTDDMILYTENPEEATIKLLKLITNLVKLQDTRLTYKKLLYFHTLTMNYQKEELRKQSHLQLHSQEQNI